ncbi:hypothetical protein HDU84_003895 [Entophlyctis sp. JEL0112]|nr:hypothetical protein HDU84_003895 [Entophlyctis sp. JEL0112]
MLATPAAACRRRLACPSVRPPPVGAAAASFSAAATPQPRPPVARDPDELWSVPSWSSAVVRPYKDKSLGELLNSYAVLRLCEFPPLVSMAPTLLSIAHKTGTAPVMDFGVKHTFYKHFCGGETVSDVLPTMSKLKNRNLGSILDLAIEADVKTAVQKSEAVSTDSDAIVASAKKTSSYILRLMKESISTASENPGSYIAAKVTAYVPPDVLLRWTNSLRLVREAFDACKPVHTTTLSDVPPGVLATNVATVSRADFLAQLQKRFPKLTSEHVSWGNSENVDWCSVLDHFTFANKPLRPALVVPAASAQAGAAPRPELQPVTDATDFAVLDAVYEDLHALAAYAAETGVKVMVDAEQTYFQRAIDDISNSLCRSFNTRAAGTGTDAGGRSRVVVLNTYQMYLVDGLARLQMDHARANGPNGWTFAAKIVRGAYLVSERERAAALGYADPVHKTAADTHAAYDFAAVFVLRHLAAADGELVVATHNKTSVAKTVLAMGELGMDGDCGKVSFAQLLGMRDATSMALAANGFRCAKYVPYGPVEVCVPYLLRRAQENSTVLGGVGEDKRDLEAEISRRLR